MRPATLAAALYGTYAPAYAGPDADAAADLAAAERILAALAESAAATADSGADRNGKRRLFTEAAFYETTLRLLRGYLTGTLPPPPDPYA